MRRCLLVLVVACSTPPSRPTPSPQPDAPSRPCVLEGKWLEQPDELRMSPGGAPYATVFGVSAAHVTFEEGVLARLVTPSLELEGFVDPKQLQLHARRPVVIGGFLVPGPKFPLGFVASRASTLVIEAVPQVITAKAPVRVELRCGELAIDNRAFDPRTALADKSLRRTSLASGRDVPLSIDAGSAPIAMLHYENSPQIDVLETRGAHVRVVVLPDAINPNLDIVVFGWVPASDVLEIAQGMGGSWARGGDRSPMNARPSKRPRVACAEPIALSVQRDRDVRKVGHIAANTVIELVDDNDPVEVMFPRAHAELAEGARWLVERAALAKCATPP